MIKKIIKTEVTNCRRCSHSYWSEKTEWKLFCPLLNKIIAKEGQEYPIPKSCTLDNMEKCLNFKGCYQILNVNGEVIAELLASTAETFNDTKFLKRVIDVLEKRYFKLRDMRNGHDIQITLEDGGHIKTGE